MVFETRSVYEYLKDISRDCLDRTAIVYDDESITYGQMIREIEDISLFLLSKGAKPGTKVAIYAANYLKWMPLYIGIMRAGCVAVAINTRLPLTSTATLMNFTDVEYVFYGISKDTKGIDSEAEVIAKAVGIPEDNIYNVFTTDFSKNNYDTSEYTALERNKITEEDVKADSFVIFTSGSTASPKAVMLSQYGVLNTSLRLSDGTEIISGGRALVCAPMFHIYGIIMTLIVLLKLGTVYYISSGKARHIASAVESYQIDELMSVAVIVQKIIDREELLEKTVPYLKKCFISGSYISPAQFSRFESAFEGATFYNLYGLTEIHGPGAISRRTDAGNVRTHTVGKHLEDVELAIWDKDKGMCAPGEIGEILFRGFIKNSYYKLEGEAQAVDEDGWFHTGDQGVLDEDGNLRIVGRIKDIIIKGGENISPSEIEDAIKYIDGVKECRVLGFNDKLYGENISACIIMDEGTEFDETKARIILKESIGSFKVPAYFIIFDEFPINDNGKIDSRQLRVQMNRRLGELEFGSDFAYNA